MSSVSLTSSVPQRWTPPGFEPSDPAAPVFLVRAASVIERAHWRRDVASQGCRYPSDGDLYAAMKDMVADSGAGNADAILEAMQLVADADAEAKEIAAEDPQSVEALADIETGAEGATVPARIEDPAAKILDDARKLVDRMRVILSSGPGPYASLLAQRQEWAEVAPYLAAQRFCAGWEGADLPTYEARAGRVTDQALGALPTELRLALGWRCVEVMNLSGQARKN